MNIEAIKKILARERAARKDAEKILEQKSFQLYLLNTALKETNASLEEIVESKTEKLRGINELATTLLKQTTLDEIAQAIVNTAIVKFKLEDCAIYFWDDNHEYLLQRAASENEQQEGLKPGRSHRIKAGKGTIGTVAISGQSIMTKGAAVENQGYSELAVAILEKGQVIGVIDSRHTSPNFFNEEHLDSFSTVARLASTQINYAISSERQAKIEKELRENQARFEMIVEHASEIIFELDSQGHYTYINPVFTKKMGYSLEELKTIHYLELVADSHKEEVNVFFTTQHRCQTPETNLEFAVISKHGETIWISQNTRFSYSPSGQLISITAIARDITEKVKYTNELKLQEEKYRNIISNMDLGLLEVNQSDVIIRANQSFCKHSGYLEEELLGKKAQDLLLTEESDRKLVHQKNQLRSHGISDSYQLRIKNKQGDYRWWLVSGALNYDTKGNQIGSIGIHLDITSQKRLEQELEIAKQKAEEFAKTKDAFLANMSHEIRTPLNAIIGILRELRRENLSGLQNSYLKNVWVASQHLLSIVNDILDMSKIEAGEFQLEKTHFSISNVIEETIFIVSGKALEKQLDLETFVSENMPKALVGDPTRIRQILINIVNNSIKFTPDGKVSIRCQGRTIDNNVYEVHLSITDTGIGMNASYVKNLFKQFSQEDVSTARQYGGTGLGMAITQEFVKMMDGNIQVASEKGIGTTIDIFLPLEIGDESKTKTPVKDQDFSRLKNKKVLLVEDNAMNRLVASTTMDHFGISTTEVENGLLAIEKLKHESFDFILMDLQMPIMGGLEATQIILNELQIESPIIALTANAIKKEIDRCLEVGMKGYVTKPFEEKVLLNALLENLTDSEISSNTEVSEKVDLPIYTEKSSHEKLYDLSKLHQISRGNHAFVLKMIHLFLEQIPDSVQDMQEALEQGTFKRVKEIAHSIKPIIDKMGITSLQEEIREIEHLANEEPDSVLLPDLVHHTCTVLQQVSWQLKEDDIFS